MSSRLVSLCLLPGCLLSLAGQLFAGSITHHTFDSSVLGRQYAYNLYLPDDYATSELAYPVLYLLHGSGGSEFSWPRQGKVLSTVDDLIETGTIPPAIIVMPGSRSWWADGYNEAAKTAFFADLIPHVEESWQAIPARGGRLLAGLSAGGWGTVNFVLEHPDMFVAAAALSPAVYIPYPPPTSSAHTHPTFVGQDGKFDKALWDRLNYARRIESYKAQDLVVPLYINSGDHDGFDIAWHAASLYQTLREHQPDRVEFRVVDGGHDWQVWAGTLPEALTYIFQFSSRPIAQGENN